MTVAEKISQAQENKAYMNGQVDAYKNLKEMLVKSKYNGLSKEIHLSTLKSNYEAAEAKTIGCNQLRFARNKIKENYRVETINMQESFDKVLEKYKYNVMKNINIYENNIIAELRKLRSKSKTSTKEDIIKNIDKMIKDVIKIRDEGKKNTNYHEYHQRCR